MQDARVGTLDRADLLRALRAATAALLREPDDTDAEIAGALRALLLEMAGVS